MKFIPGLELSEHFFHDIVLPLLAKQFPGIPTPQGGWIMDRMCWGMTRPCQWTMVGD